MTVPLAVSTLRNSQAPRPERKLVIRSDRGYQSIPISSLRPHVETQRARCAVSAPVATVASFFSLLQKDVLGGQRWEPERNSDWLSSSASSTPTEPSDESPRSRLSCTNRI